MLASSALRALCSVSPFLLTPSHCSALWALDALSGCWGESVVDGFDLTKTTTEGSHKKICTPKSDAHPPRKLSCTFLSSSLLCFSRTQTLPPSSSYPLSFVPSTPFTHRLAFPLVLKILKTWR
ncbi:hypothetical protein BDN72DRAFT_842322 [Pluteus cervinus]|uniref:Uncharacterized protein n=1 Tax=Pluteus cervinus TaxID=181527 RepID=A0ACD3ASY3_9AGAR|nr:hypothetical protein BDN72DRAFT_842322 [Pluteus cervinus]